MPQGGPWPRLALWAAFLLGRGREVHDLPSYSFSGGSRNDGGLGSLVREGGEGLAPQGWALIKQREGVTDRPSRRDREGQ